MKAFKKDNGYTLIEVVLVLGLVGVLLVLLSVNYLSIHKAYIKSAQKADNLEEARLVINELTDNFRKYEAGYCQVLIGEPGVKLVDHGEGTVKKIIFKKQYNSVGSDIITYDKANKRVSFEGNEISSHIIGFTVKRKDQLYDFVIEVEQAGNKAMPEQRITVGTTVNLKYMKNIP
ncbi:MAG TPA: prepilin-type N-terminal cleavage/methylation domain-containing protein [Epulopiscium sp.]|nr:prepilin-type N-terminal cleavage/methylation domain-containing protein [Candidatus Epulonipiscium sp.]